MASTNSDTFRISTLALFILLAVIALSNTNPFFEVAGVTLALFQWLNPSSKTFVVLAIIQRGLTSLVFYLRVHALYRSSYWIQGFFIVALVGTMAACGLVFTMSGPVSGFFDLLVFLAILCKLGRRPDIRRVNPNVGDRASRWTFWVPFRRNQVYQITDRLLQDSLLYLL